jgi:phospholipid transport system transporter-binding protein
MLLLPATITLREARDTLRLLAQALQADKDATIVIDASPLQQFDTSALAVLLECRRLAMAWGKAFAVRRAPEKLGELAALYGVDVLLFSEGAAA